jgi:hypothetical protein
MSAQKNHREAMPICTAFIDRMRESFGDPVSIVAVEAGHEVRWGKPLPAAGWRPVILMPRDIVAPSRRAKKSAVPKGLD